MASPTPLSALLTPLTKTGPIRPTQREPEEPPRQQPTPTRRATRSQALQSPDELARAKRELSNTLSRFGREALGRPAQQPEFRHPGQIIDIRV